MIVGMDARQPAKSNQEEHMSITMLIYTILGVFFIPVLYVVIEQVWAKLFRRRPKGEAAVAAVEA